MRQPVTRRLGIRTRIVAVTTAVTAVVLVLAALTLAAGVWRAERAALDDRMRAVAAEIGTLVEENRLPTTLPISGAGFVQVVDASGAVVSASTAADRLNALLTVDEIAAAREDPVEVPASRVAASGQLRAVALDAGPESRRLTVLVASPAESPATSQRGLWLGLLIWVPLLVLLVAWLLWRAVGAALAPVDRLRAGAERIGVDSSADTRGGAAPARLPVPGPDDEIRALAITLNGMVDRLDAASTAQQRFIADAAHELRSPVASLRMQIEVAEHIGEGDELAGELRPDVERLSRLVDDLLLLARAGSPQSAHRPEPVDAAGLVGDLAGRYGSARVPIDVTTAGPAWAEVDRSGLERCVINLVDNALRHARSRVGMTVHETDDALSIDVIDDGAGIPEVDRERVFDRFTRLDEARAQDAGGSGLGLSIVRELVRRDGGEVCLLDRPDGSPGLLARIILPTSPATVIGSA